MENSREFMEGWNAYVAGWNRNTCPYGDPFRINFNETKESEWISGWDLCDHDYIMLGHVNKAFPHDRVLEAKSIIPSV